MSRSLHYIHIYNYEKSIVQKISPNNQFHKITYAICTQTHRSLSKREGREGDRQTNKEKKKLIGVHTFNNGREITLRKIMEWGL